MIVVNPICPKTVDQVEVGRFYAIRGTCHNLEPELDDWLRLPPQMVLIKSKVKQNGALGTPHWQIHLWAHLGQGGQYDWETVLFADQVNIPEHGLHDHHLERIDDEVLKSVQILKAENMKDDYEEMVA